MNCVPLSDTMVFGKPSRAKSERSALMVDVDVVEAILMINGNFEKELTIIRHTRFSKEPAKSIWKHFQAATMHGQLVYCFGE